MSGKKTIIYHFLKATTPDIISVSLHAVLNISASTGIAEN